MDTSRPEKVLMNAANAPAQVMPLRMEPQGIFDPLVAGAAEREPGGRGAEEPSPPFFTCSFRIRGSSSTILSVPLAPVPAYRSGRRLRPMTPNTGGNK